MLNQLLNRWLRPAKPPRRHAVQNRWQASVNPPAPHRGDSFLQTLMRWIPGETDAWAATSDTRPAGELPVMRERFLVKLDDIHSDDVEGVLTRIRRSRSLSDLWHLRPAVFNLVARAHDQAEAEVRMACLNRLFATRPDLSVPTRNTWH